MSFLDSWAESIGEFGGAIASKIGLGLDMARIGQAGRANSNLQKHVAEPVTRAATGFLDLAEDVYKFNVARPLTQATGALRIGQQESARQGEGAAGEWRRLFSGDVWEKADDRAIRGTFATKEEDRRSPGQGATELLYGAFAPDDRAQEIKGLSDQQFNERYRDDLGFHAASGSLDFAARWYLDPLNVVGKGAGVSRRFIQKAPLGPGADVAAAVETGRIGKRVSSITAPQTRSWNAHQFYVGVQGLKESTGGMAIASALSKANKIDDPMERELQMKLVQRITYGDQSARAELAKRNTEIMDQLAGGQKQVNDLMEANKWEDLGNGKSRYWDKPEVQEVFAERLGNLEKLQQLAESEVKRLDEVGTVFGTVRDRTLRVTGSTAARARRYGQSEAGLAARELTPQNPFKTSTIRHSLWNVPVKLVTAPFRLADSMSTMAPQGYIHLHDANSSQVLDAMFSKVRDFDPAKRSAFVAEFIEAGEEGARQMVVDRAETALFGHIAKKYDIDKKSAALLVNQYQMQRAGWRNRAKMYAGVGQTEAYSSAPDAQRAGLTADSFIDEDGVVNRVPLLSTQLRDSVPVLNANLVEHVMKRNSNKLKAINEWGGEVENAFGNGLGRAARRADITRWGVSEFTSDGLNLFNRLWKFGVLFRLGYPLRNVTDEQMRMWAKLDSGMSQLYLEAGANKARNMGAKYSLQNRRTAMAAKRMDQNRLDELEDTVFSKKGKGAPALKAQYQEEFNALKAKLELSRKEGLYSVYKPEKHRIGEGSLELPDGSVIPDAFGGTDSELRRLLSSGRGVHERLIFEGENSGYARMTAGGDWVDIAPTEPGHAEAWLDAMNHQIRQDPMARMVLGGQSDKQISQWLKSDPKGRALSRRLPFHAANRDDWIANVRSHVDSYVPDAGMREALLTRNLTGKDIEALRTAGHAPRVNGPSLENALGQGPVSAVTNRFMTTAMKYLSELPADYFSRHPMYAALYRQRAKQEADSLLADPNRLMLNKHVDKLDQEDLDHILKVSHDYALKEMKGTLYDITAHSNAAQAMRFMSPFMGAWQETLGRWWNIAKDKPQILNYANLGWQLPNKMGLVVDREGRPVEKSEGLTDDEFLVLRLPKWAGGKQFEMFDSVPYIPKSAFNLALQGDPWWLPGFGPMVQIPVGYFQTKVPQADEVAKFVNPFGPARDMWDAVSPATVKRIRSYIQGPAARDFGQDNYRIFNQMAIEWEQGGREGPKPTWKEAEQRTKDLYKLRIANNFLNPYPASFRSPMQFYIDGYKILQEQARSEERDQSWVDDQFMSKYGEDYFVLAQSMSKNNAGLDPTAEAVKAYKKYKSIVDEHPEYISQIVGDHPGDFNSSAYAYQLGTQYEPGSDKTMRSLKSPKEAQADNEAKLGWLKYRKFIDGLDAIANDRGLATHREADDLMAMKKVAVAKLAADNPTWNDRYESASSARTFDNQIPELKEIANDKRLNSDPTRTDIASLKKYLTVRDLIGKVIAARQAQGLGGITAQANEPLLRIFSVWAQNLAGSDTKFSANWFNGKLEFDPMMVDTTTPSGVTDGS